MNPSKPLLLVAALLAGGCANTYLDAKSNTAAGGQQERDIQAANVQLQSAQVQNVALQSSADRRAEEIRQNNVRIHALQTDLKRQDAQLAAALKSKQLSQARYAQLKREVDGLRADTQNAELLNQSSALDKTPNAAADAAKAAKLADLEKRKKALEATLVELTKAN